MTLNSEDRKIYIDVNFTFAVFFIFLSTCYLVSIITIRISTYWCSQKALFDILIVFMVLPIGLIASILFFFAKY